MAKIFYAYVMIIKLFVIGLIMKMMGFLGVLMHSAGKKDGMIVKMKFITLLTGCPYPNPLGLKMEWIKTIDRLPNKPGVYPVKIDGFVNYCSFSFECWYWMQALNADNMMHLRRHPLVGMQMKVDEWLDIPDPTV